MVYVKGQEPLEKQLEIFGLAKSPENADCAVIQMPGNKDALASLPDIPVLVVVNGMMSLADTRAVKQRGAKIVKEEDLAEEIQSLQSIVVEDDDEIISFDDEIISFEEEILPVKKPEPTKINPGLPKARQERGPKPPEEDKIKMPIMRLRPTINKDTYEPVYEKKEEKTREAPKRQILNPRTTRGLIVASYSSSGGVGKTFMACSVAALCAMNNISTVLVDLDLGFGNIDIETGLVDEVERNRVLDKKTTPKSNWATVTDWRKHAVDLKSNILRHNSGLYVVPSFPYAGRELPEAEIEDLLHTLSEAFDLVVVDLGVDGFSNQARVALRMSNAIIIVAGQDTKTIGKLTHFLSQEGGRNNKMHLVFNMRKPTGFYNPKEIAKKMMFDKYYSVPLDEGGVHAAKLQRKVVVQIPGTVAGEAVKNFAAAVLPFNIDAGEIIGHKKNNGFFAKIMSRFRRA